MIPKPVTRWGLLNRSTTKLDGERCHLIFDNCLPALFCTRAEARCYAEDRFGYIRQRPDLRREPHCCRVPQAVRVTIAIADQSPEGRDPKGLDAKHASGGAEGNRPTPSTALDIP